MEKRLYRSTKSRMLFGVCGGLAEYLNTDPTVVRLITVLLFALGMGILVYFIAALIIPEEPKDHDQNN